MDTNDMNQPSRRRRERKPETKALSRPKPKGVARSRTAMKPKEHRPPRPRPEQPRQERAPHVVFTAPKHQSRTRFLLKLGSMVAVVAAIFFCLSLFFRVETIEVAGADKYTPWMVREASGLEEGDALLSIGEARVASRIISNLPYVDQVKVRIKLPGTVQIELTELQVTYAILDEAGQWWLVSSEGRAVEPIEKDKAKNYTRVEGLRIHTPEQGSQMIALAEASQSGQGETPIAPDQSEANERLTTLLSILSGLEAQRIIGKVERIDVTDPADLKLIYPSLLTVKLGSGERMEHKLGYMAAALEQLAENAAGELDVSLSFNENAIFTPAG